MRAGFLGLESIGELGEGLEGRAGFLGLEGIGQPWQGRVGRGPGGAAAGHEGRPGREGSWGGGGPGRGLQSVWVGQGEGHSQCGQARERIAAYYRHRGIPRQSCHTNCDTHPITTMVKGSEVLDVESCVVRAHRAGVSP